MSFVRRLLRQTGAYRLFQDFRSRKEARGWTEHDARLSAWYETYLTRGSLVFDIGANRGKYAKVFRYLRCPVVAVEPQPQCAALLQSLFRLDDGFTLERCALGAEPGRADIHIADVDTLSSMSAEWISETQRSGRARDYRWSKAVSVEVKTLDLLISRYGVPDFIKIDVEGFERQVIEGLSTPVRLISLEFAIESLDDIRQCLDRMRSLGSYEYNISLFDSYSFANNDWRRLDSLDPFKPFEDVKLLAGEIVLRRL